MAKNETIIGRKNELEILERLYTSHKSEFLIVYGRRRVGKTFLIDQRFDEHFSFRMSALSNATGEQQLAKFQTLFNASVDPDWALSDVPKNWLDAFQSIIKCVQRDTRSRKVLFFDELPWFDTHNSDFMMALDDFWNNWAARRSDILLIGCGSAASWMINKLILNRGGLHNRITERILLQPFTLHETEAFLKSKGGVFDRYQLLELYMAMGGIPYYLDNVLVNRSIAQNIDRMFFTPGAILNIEYIALYRSLFNRYDKHVTIVETLAEKSKGLTRAELLTAAKLSDGGSTSNILDELEHSGFIQRYFPFGKTKRDALYQLIDPYTLFYLTFVKDAKARGQGAWLAQADSPKWRAWSGYAFESICCYHIDAIKKRLGISGIYTEISTWRSQKSAKGAQIDLVIDRNDRVINLCEMKFSIDSFSITKSYSENLSNKLMAFRNETGTKKTLFLTMITTYGLKSNTYSQQLVNDSLDMSALFEGS
jgi:predicted AAA+ superfamily ATPase